MGREDVSQDSVGVALEYKDVTVGARCHHQWMAGLRGVLRDDLGTESIHVLPHTASAFFDVKHVSEVISADATGVLKTGRQNDRGVAWADSKD